MIPQIDSYIKNLELIKYRRDLWKDLLEELRDEFKTSFMINQGTLYIDGRIAEHQFNQFVFEFFEFFF